MVVLKFGGTSVGNPRRIRRAAQRVRRQVQRGARVVVVVSAAGQSTDRILRWHRAVAPGEGGQPIGRE
ncbi:MAG: aspartate kinase, partial [Gemmatimonadetes bacterium]|nr:aspartate kinase [Gemmatimonadota bacterium]